MMDGWDGWSLVTVVVVVVFCAFVFTAMVISARHVTGGASNRGSRTAAANRAEGVPADRFGRGEIDKDESRRRMTALRSHQPS